MPTAPVFPVGIVTWRALGRPEETGTVSLITDIPAPFIAAHAFRAALDPEMKKEVRRIDTPHRNVRSIKYLA